MENVIKFVLRIKIENIFVIMYNLNSVKLSFDFELLINEAVLFIE